MPPTLKIIHFLPPCFFCLPKATYAQILCSDSLRQIHPCIRVVNKEFHSQIVKERYLKIRIQAMRILFSKHSMRNYISKSTKSQYYEIMILQYIALVDYI